MEERYKVELAKIKRCLRLKEKDEFLKRGYNLLLAVIIETYYLHLPSLPENDRKKAEDMRKRLIHPKNYPEKDDTQLMMGKWITICNQAGLFKKLGGKEFTENILRGISDLRGNHVHNSEGIKKLLGLSSEKEDFELRTVEAEYIYHHLTKMLEELGYDSHVGELCVFCANDLTDRENGKNKACSFCILKHEILRKYVFNLEKSIKDTIEPILKPVSRDTWSTQEKSEEILDFIRASFDDWFRRYPEELNEPMYHFFQNFLDYCQEKLEESKLSINRVKELLDDSRPEIRIEGINNDLENDDLPEYVLDALLESSSAFALKSFYSFLIPDSRAVLDKKNSINRTGEFLKRGGVLESVRIFLQFYKNGGIDGSWEYFDSFLPDTRKKEERKVAEFIAVLNRLFHDE